MDPEACLKDAEGYLSEGDAEEAHEVLASYWAWRRNGGFEPANGDKRARQLDAHIREHLQP